MKDSKQVRSEYQSFVESYSSIAAKGAEEAKEVEMKKKSSKKEKEHDDDDKECSCEMVLMRKSGAFTELAERYQMSVKQFARFVEANQGLFDIETRKKAVLANKFSGFKESVEWDEFFGDLELVESLQSKVKGALDKAANFMDTNPVGKAAKKVLQPVGAGRKTARPMGGDKTQLTREEVEELQEVQTKETASGTKYKVRVKEKDTGSSYIRYATREKIAQLRADPKIASVEMTDEGEAPEDKGEKKAQAKGGGLAVKAKKMKEKKEREAAAPAKPAKRSVTTEGMDPVGQEDADIDNDGDTDKSDEYLHKRRKAIGKAMKKRGTKKESFSNWREELKEITDVQDAKKIKGGKVNNKVVINPPMGEGFDPQKIAESLGAELVDCQEVEEAVKGGSAPNMPAPVVKFVDELPQNVKKAAKKIKSMVTSEAVGGSVKMKPGSGLGGGVPSYPRGQEPKKTGAQLPKLQKAGFEPEGEQIDELAPLVAGGLALGAAALGGAAIHRARQASKSGVEAAKKGEKIKPGTGIGQASYGLQRYADSRRKAMELLKQETEVEGEVIDEKKLTKPEMKKKEEIVKSMKKDKKGFQARYGDRAKEVMYATATKIAKKKA
jgi:hypothetical protein